MPWVHLTIIVSLIGLCSCDEEICAADGSTGSCDATGEALLQVRGKELSVLEVDAAFDLLEADRDKVGDLTDHSKNDFTDLGTGECRVVNKIDEEPKHFQIRMPYESSCKLFCWQKTTPDSSGQKCWGYTMTSRGCKLWMEGPLTVLSSPFTEDHCNIVTKFHPNQGSSGVTAGEPEHESERQRIIDNLRTRLKLHSISRNETAKLTKSKTGCTCFFDETKKDCACCEPTQQACQCNEKHRDKCAPCRSMWRCELEDDMAADPNWFEHLSLELLTELVVVLQAKTYEVRQAGIRAYLKEAYHQKTSLLKMKAVALLDAKINTQKMAGAEPIFEFPDASEIEVWLSQMFLEEDLFKGDINTALLGLESRPQLLQVAKSCDWHKALNAFYHSQGYYGNWCGVNEHINNTAVSSGVCDMNPDHSQPSKFKVHVCKDSGFDEACSRHDQGTYGESVFGLATKSLCKVDGDFHNARKALQVDPNSKDPVGRAEAEALAGANCLFNLMPCLRYETQSYWSWCTSWSGGYPCKKTGVGYFTHYPFGNYNFADSACGPTGCYSVEPDAAFHAALVTRNAKPTKSRAGLKLLKINTEQTDADFTDLGKGYCRLINKTDGSPITFFRPKYTFLRRAKEPTCKQSCLEKSEPDSTGAKCWGYGMIPRGCYLHMEGPLTLLPPHQYTRETCTVLTKSHVTAEEYVERQGIIDNLRSRLKFDEIHWGETAHLTKNQTGCTCYFDEMSKDCACCNPTGCQCNRKLKNKCAPCQAMWRCELEDDLSDDPNLFEKLPLELLTQLVTVLEAKTYEVRQSGIREYLRQAYHQKTTQLKMRAVALLDAKINEQRSTGAEPIFEFPGEDEIEDWLSQMFLEEDLFHGDNTTAFLGLESRPQLLQVAKSCDWHAALRAFYDSKGHYGNWCGANEWDKHNRAISSGVCDSKPELSRPSKFQVHVCKDSGLDEACSRHDQGTYGESVYGVATKSLCKVDGDFSNVRKALQVDPNSKDPVGRAEAEALAGANCLFDMMPCLRYETKSYWDWCTSWTGGYPCKKTSAGYFTHYPFGKYDFGDAACGPTGCYSVEPDEAFAATPTATLTQWMHLLETNATQDGDFKDLGPGHCRFINKTDGSALASPMPKYTFLRRAKEPACQQSCLEKSEPDSNGQKCWGYGMIPRGCFLFMEGPLTLLPPRSQWTRERCIVATKFHVTPEKYIEMSVEEQIDNLMSKLKFDTISWGESEQLTKNKTGCACYFNEKRNDCACCYPTACQCNRKHKDKCAPCQAMWRCELEDDMSDDPKLFEKLPRKLLTKLMIVLEAQKYEVRQAGIRGYLKESYHQPTSQLKIRAVALLDAKLNEQRVAGSEPIFEFPGEDEIEDWLSQMFLEEDLFSGDNTTAFLGLNSRPQLLQVAKSCDWHAALSAFYDSKGHYGNWCGANEWDKHNRAISSGVCDSKPELSRPSKFQVHVCKDSGFDEACSRHDQGTYGESVYGIATKSLCKVDGDFSKTRKALQVHPNSKDPVGRAEAEALAGANCLFDMMPCLRYETQSYWSWCTSWTGGYPCKKTGVGYFTHYPFGKYEFADDACGPTGCYQLEPDESFVTSTLEVVNSILGNSSALEVDAALDMLEVQTGSDDNFTDLGTGYCRLMDGTEPGHMGLMGSGEFTCRSMCLKMKECWGYSMMESGIGCQLFTRGPLTISKSEQTRRHCHVVSSKHPNLASQPSAESNQSERQSVLENLRHQLKLDTMSSDETAKLTTKETGCACYFDEMRSDCACCAPTACQCAQKHKNKCAPCKAMWRCEIENDISEDPKLFDKVDVKLLSSLLVTLEAHTYETRQAGIREYLREAYHRTTSIEKLQAVALLDAKINEQRMEGAEPMFEFPDVHEVENWLSQMFLEEDLFAGDAAAAFLGLESRPHLLQVAKSCDWHAALQAFYDAGGYYGNWCGANEWKNNTSVSSGVCDVNPEHSKPSKFQVHVCKDSGFDEACSRHDQGTYGESVYGLATKSLCKVDGDFSKARKALQVDANSKDPAGRAEAAAVAGANCLFDLMPCLRYEEKTYWDWCTSWTGGYPCKKAGRGYFTYYPFGKYEFTDDACGPTGCYQVDPDPKFVISSSRPGR